MNVNLAVRTLKAAFRSCRMTNNGIVVLLGCGVWQLQGKVFVLCAKCHSYRSDQLDFHKAVFAKMGYKGLVPKEVKMVERIEDAFSAFKDNSIPSVVAISPANLVSNRTIGLVAQKPRPFCPSWN